MLNLCILFHESYEKGEVVENIVTQTQYGTCWMQGIEKKQELIIHPKGVAARKL